jgi:hypothetical protein
MPDNLALQALYPQDGPLIQGVGEGGMQYALYQWLESPLSVLLADDHDQAIKTAFGWTPEPVLGSGSWDRIPLDEAAVLGDVLELKGYQPLWEEPLQVGKPLQMLSYWKVINPPQEDIKLFLHLIDENGEIIAQHDGLDISVQGLQPGDELIQLHTAQLPENLTPGDYGLQIGAYRVDDFSRLLLADDRSDRILLDKYPVIAAP